MPNDIHLWSTPWYSCCGGKCLAHTAAVLGRAWSSLSEQNCAHCLRRSPPLEEEEEGKGKRA